MKRFDKRCYQVSSIVFGIIAVIFIISGSLLVAENEKSNYFKGYSNDWMDRENKYQRGLRMLSMGVILTIVSFILVRFTCSLKSKALDNARQLTIPTINCQVTAVPQLLEAAKASAPTGIGHNELKSQFPPEH